MAITEAPERCRFDCEYSRLVEGDNDPLACAECDWQRAWEQANVDGTVPNFERYVVWCPKRERDCEQCFALALQRMNRQVRRLPFQSIVILRVPNIPNSILSRSDVVPELPLGKTYEKNPPAPPMPHSPWSMEANWVCAGCSESPSSTRQTFQCRSNLPDPDSVSTSQCYRCFWDAAAKRAGVEGRKRPVLCTEFGFDGVPTRRLPTLV